MKTKQKVEFEGTPAELATWLKKQMPKATIKNIIASLDTEVLGSLAEVRVQLDSLERDIQDESHDSTVRRVDLARRAFEDLQSALIRRRAYIRVLGTDG